MTRLVALLAALAAALVFAPAADAATVGFVVNQSGDATDTTPGDGHCDTDPAVGDQCTLRAAIEEANADPGTTDTITITFAGAGQAPNPLAALPAITKTTVYSGQITGP